MAKIDPKSGFSIDTKIYHSLRPDAPLFSENDLVSVSDYAFSLLRTSLSHKSSAAGFVDAVTGHCIPYPEFIRRTDSLAAFLQKRIGLSKGDTAFILSPNTVHVPILYFSLFSLGIVISPSNPINTKPEISRQIELSKPTIAFVTSANAHKIFNTLRHGTILIDSHEFESMMTSELGKPLPVDISQLDPATILYSSGTTGRVKGVVLTHRNWTSMISGAQIVRPVRAFPLVLLCTVPYFHVYGFLSVVRSVAFGETLLSMERFDAGQMMKVIEKYKVTHVALAPPLIIKMIKDDKLMDGSDLSSLEAVSCGGAPLAGAAIERFTKRLPNIQLAQAYGLTETTGGITRTIGIEESKVFGASGRLVSNCQAKIVDVETGKSLAPMKAGELWIRGPLTMKGYIGDEVATAQVLDPNGWLRTGDLCYFNNEGFLFYVERLKELIKCNGYQVAPAELEHLLLSHPDIMDSAVIPFPDEDAGQLPIAFVVRRPKSTISESQIKNFIAKQVAPYKKIKHVFFIDSIPKNAPGKILRKELMSMVVTSKL